MCSGTVNVQRTEFPGVIRKRQGGLPSPCAFWGDSVVNVHEGIGGGVKARWVEDERSRDEGGMPPAYNWAGHALFNILTFLPRQEEATEGF